MAWLAAWRPPSEVRLIGEVDRYVVTLGLIAIEKSASRTISYTSPDTREPMRLRGGGAPRPAPRLGLRATPQRSTSSKRDEHVTPISKGPRWPGSKVEGTRTYASPFSSTVSIETPFLESVTWGECAHERKGRRWMGGARGWGEGGRGEGGRTHPVGLVH